MDARTARTSRRPDHFISCQKALEPAVLQLVDDAAAAGWSAIETTEAIIAIAETHLLASIENELVRAKLARSGMMQGRCRTQA